VPPLFKPVIRDLRYSSERRQWGGERGREKREIEKVGRRKGNCIPTFLDKVTPWPSICFSSKKIVDLYTVSTRMLQLLVVSW